MKKSNASNRKTVRSLVSVVCCRVNREAAFPKELTVTNNTCLIQTHMYLKYRSRPFKTVQC